jgi:serine protein kinase
MGVVGSRYECESEYAGEKYNSYVLQVTGDDVIDLLEQTGSLREKNLSEGPLAPRSGKTNYDLIDLSSVVASIMDRVPYGQRGPFYRIRRYGYGSGPGARKFSRKSLRHFVSIAEKYMTDNELRLFAEVANDNFLYLEVIEAERMGREQVYDLTVPGTHSFCANGILCHNSQDVSELIGSVDLSKIAEFGDESDPRAYKFNGELNISNRGLLEFIEILKTDQRFLYVLLTATQEKVIKTPRYPLIYIDEAIIAHTNECEYRDFVGNPKNEALIDRMIVCKVKYNLSVDDEVRIYEKLLKQGEMDNVHIAPHTLRVAAIFAVLSRLDEPKEKGLDKVKKMKLYNNEDVEGFSRKDVPRLKRAGPNEGMDGVSPRYVINRLVTTAIRASEGKREDGSSRQKYVTPIEAMRALKDGLQTSSKFKPEQCERYENILQLAKQEFDVIARNEVQKAFFVSFESEARVFMDNYLDNVEAYLEKSTIEDPLTREEMAPDEKLMRSIETKIGISESEKDSFRNEIMRKVGIASRVGKKFGYEEHARLREAIEKELFEAKREVIKMTISSRTMKDPEQLKRVNQVVKVLCDEHGYIPESANDLLKYVSSMMAREK